MCSAQDLRDPGEVGFGPDRVERHRFLGPDVGWCRCHSQQHRGVRPGKNAVIQEILTAAGLTDNERKIIDAAQVPSREEVPR